MPITDIFTKDDLDAAVIELDKDFTSRNINLDEYNQQRAALIRKWKNYLAVSTSDLPQGVQFVVYEVA